jgi:hypothetical protein
MDRRYFVVEYKEADLYSTDNLKEKYRLVELWELKSNGSCLFQMTEGRGWKRIMTKENSSKY